MLDTVDTKMRLYRFNDKFVLQCFNYVLTSDKISKMNKKVFEDVIHFSMHFYQQYEKKTEEIMRAYTL